MVREPLERFKSVPIASDVRSTHSHSTPLPSLAR
jgi:hypothetical protein